MTLINPNKKLFVALVLSLILPYLVGCKRSSEPETYISVTPERLTRLSRTSTDRQQDLEPLLLPAQKWKISDATRSDTDVTTTITRLSKDTQIGYHCSIAANSYNVLKITLRTNGDGPMKFAWASTLSPEGPSQRLLPNVQWLVENTEESAEYTIPLITEQDICWLGSINKLFLIPPESATEFTFEAVSLIYDPKIQRRVTLGTQTMEVLPAYTPYGWKFMVPEKCILETYTGVHRRAGTNPTDPVRFIIQVSLDGHAAITQEISTECHPTFQDKESPGWEPVQVDLSAYSGKNIKVTMRTHFPDGPGENYAFWGNPSLRVPVLSTRGIPIILITNDTLRADHVSYYGYHRETTPFLDQWAATEAVAFENAVTPEPWTLNSHMTILTGLTPKSHGVSSETHLSPHIQSFQEGLQQAGYLTAGFTSHLWWLAPWRGYARGFDFYDCPTKLFRPFYETYPRMTSWIERHRDHSMFVWFHNFDIHFKTKQDGYRYPYHPGDDSHLFFSRPWLQHTHFDTPPKNTLMASELLDEQILGNISFTQDEHSLMTALYDDCIRMVDQGIGELFNFLQQHDLYDQSLIIVTADHGEDLEEHGYYGHARVYETECRVPLFIRFPGGEFAGQRYHNQVSLADIMPTVYSVLNIKPPLKLDGQDLRNLLTGNATPVTYTHIQRRDRFFAVRSNEWKLHRELLEGNRGYHLYNIVKDPLELNDLYTQEHDIANKLQIEMEQYFDFPEAGWRINLQIAEDMKWDGNIHITSSAQIQGARYYSFWEQMRTIEPSNTNTIDIPLQSPLPQQLHLLMDTVAPVKFTITGSSPFDVHFGQHTKETVSIFEEELNPLTDTYPRPEIETSSVRPLILIWQVPPKTGGPSQEVPREIREQMKALGYVI